MTLKNDRAPLPSYFKLCASFRTHCWIQIGVTVRKRPIWVKFNDSESRVTQKFDGSPSKTIGLLFYATSSVVHFSTRRHLAARDILRDNTVHNTGLGHVIASPTDRRTSCILRVAVEPYFNWTEPLANKTCSLLVHYFVLKTFDHWWLTDC